MGTVDKTSHLFTCPGCKTKESVTVYEKGSMWGSSWQEPNALDQFEVEWKPDQTREPMPVKAVCRACGTDAVVS